MSYHYYKSYCDCIILYFLFIKKIENIMQSRISQTNNDITVDYGQKANL